MYHLGYHIIFSFSTFLHTIISCLIHHLDIIEETLLNIMPSDTAGKVSRTELPEFYTSFADISLDT